MPDLLCWPESSALIGGTFLPPEPVEWRSVGALQMFLATLFYGLVRLHSYYSTKGVLARQLLSLCWLCTVLQAGVISVAV